MLTEELKIVNLYKNKEFIPQVADWIYHEFIEGHIQDCTHSDILRALENRQEETLPMTFIGFAGTDCVGTISIFSNDLKKRPELCPWLAALYIQDKYRNRGYAKELIRKVESVASYLGFPKLYLRTETAGKYYSKQGWTRLEDLIDENGIETSVFEIQL